ncbi:MAG: DEAD/DEAH box helicase [Candidatus Anstonellales archaeon]
MAVSKPAMFNGGYLGNMSEKQANIIDSIRQMKVIPNLKNMIFNFDLELINRSINENRSIREIIKEEGIDYSKYIGELRDYQTVGVAFMYASPRSMLGDGVGLGKTAQVAGLLNYLRLNGEMRRFLMAVETSAIGQTAVELMRFTGLYIVQLPSESVKMKKAIEKIDWSKVDGIIIKHSALRSDTFSKWLALNIQEDGWCRLFDTFILDESSVIKKMTTKTAQYTRNICNLAKRVHFLNATPFETNIMDIYNQVDMMDPNLLPKKWRIEKEFCTFKMGTYWKKVNGKPQMNYKRELNGYKNQEKFKGLLKYVYFGRCKADVGIDIPHIYKVYEVEPTIEQMLSINKGYRYMEVLNCPSLIQDIKIPMDRKHVPKLDRLIDLMENEFYNDRVMIYCFHNEAQYKIADELKSIGRKPAILNGQSTDEERWKIQTKFNSGEYDVIITNIKKSLNLYGGNVCILYSMEGNPAKLEQIRGRIDRNVDDSIKTFVLLLYKGTDEYRFFMDVVKQRAKDSRDLTIDAKTAVDYFIESVDINGRE